MAADLIVDVYDDMLGALQKRADANGRSLEDEHRRLLESEFGRRETFDDDYRRRWAERAAGLRKLTEGRALTPSDVLIREAREEL